MKQVPFAHVPVLRDEIVEYLAPAAPGLLVDATVGLGGHAEALLLKLPDFELLGLDRDPEAIARARQRLAPFAARVRLEVAPFDRLPELLGSRRPAAILADLGCSSMQLDNPGRGFSFSDDGPLDMRMGSTDRTAADIVNLSSWEDIVAILKDFGEERRARAIARAIVRRRDESPFTTTGDLSRLVAEVLGFSRERIHPATRTFQALRIAVNDELGQIERFLEPAARSLTPGGRLAVISFHSLEDRIVKHTMRRLEGRCTCPPDLPVCCCSPQTTLRVLTRRPVRPTSAEIEANPRARSSRLRIAQRVEED